MGPQTDQPRIWKSCVFVKFAFVSETEYLSYLSASHHNHFNKTFPFLAASHYSRAEICTVFLPHCLVHLSLFLDVFYCFFLYLTIVRMIK